MKALARVEGFAQTIFKILAKGMGQGDNEPCEGRSFAIFDF